MAVGDYSLNPFTLPIAPNPVAMQVRNNDNLMRTKFVEHQADVVAHPTSGTLANRPASTGSGAIYVVTSVSPPTIYIDLSAGWSQIAGVSTGVTGSGTTGKLPKWATSSSLTDSIISESGTTITVAGAAIVNTSVRTPLAFNTAALMQVGTTSAHTLDLITNNVLQGRISSGGTVTLTQNLIVGSSYAGGNFGNGSVFMNTYTGADPRIDGFNNNVTSGFRRSVLFIGSNLLAAHTADNGSVGTHAFELSRSTARLFLGSSSGGGGLAVDVSILPLLITGAATTSRASIRIAHGTAPTSPTNGDFWSTTAGFFGRVNGTTVGPFAAGLTQQAAVANATGGTVIDSEARTAVNSVLARLRTLNLIAP